MAGWFQGEDPTWKWFYVPYHIPMHGTILCRPTFALSRHLSRVPGVQKRLFLGSKSNQNSRPAPGYAVPLGKCLVCNIIPKYMGEHDLGQLLSPPGTYLGFPGSKSANTVKIKTKCINTKKIKPKQQAGSRLYLPTWKVSSVQYHTHIHGRS